MTAMRDGETGQFGIEICALLLSDKGVYCIDELDKMDQVDQTAIQEEMEQQTMTIAKAGIQATLNARAIILAGANSINGRCDKLHPLLHNVSVYESTMSRSHLFFVVANKHDQSLKIHVTQNSDLVADYDLYGWDVINDSFMCDVDSSVVSIDVEYKVAVDRVDVIINDDFILDDSNQYQLSSDLGDFAADTLTTTLNHPNDTTITFNSNHITVLSFSNSSIEFKLHHCYFGIGIATIDAYTLAEWNALLLNISTNYATVDILITDSVTVGENGYILTVSYALTASPTSPTLILSTVPSGMPSSTSTSMPTFNPSTDPTNTRQTRRAQSI